MKYILRFKWPVTALMIIFAVLSFIYSPDLNQLATEKGDVQLPADSASEEARNFLESHGEDQEVMSLVLEFDGSVSEHQSDIESYISDLEAIDEVQNIVNPFSFDADMQENFINDDTGVMMIPMEYIGNETTILESAHEIEEMNVTDAEVSITSNELIQRTLEEDAMNGIQTTEIFTVVIILVVLLVMFRSVVTPFVPLIVVGLSYLIGQSFIAWFVEWFDFPVSPQTQSFLIVILFGIGTDYCILLLNRFKEELQHRDKTEAIIHTFKTGGKTVFISGISGALVFAVLYFAEFEIYRSAVGVAIGVLFLLLSLYTVLPTLMALLGRYLFWPSIKIKDVDESRVWSPLGLISIKYPTRIIFTLVAVLIAVAWFSNDEVSYDSLSELDDSYSAVHATNVISDSFDEGVVFPVQVTFSNGEDLITEEGLSRLESISETMTKIEGVSEVQTVTRPTGEPIDDLKVRSQIAQSEEGLNEINDGLAEISENLTAVSTELSGQDTGGGDLSELENGISEINEGVSGVSQYLQATGDAEGAAAQLSQLQDGLGQLSEGVTAANNELSAQQEAAVEQLSQLSDGLSEMAAGIDEINQGIEDMQSLMTGIDENTAVDGTGINVPAEFLENEALDQALDQYAFGENTAVNMNVVLSVDPYSLEAIDVLNDIEDTVHKELERLDRTETDAYFSGVTSMNRDLDQITDEDYTNVVIIFIATLFVILAVLFRSLILPVAMIGSIFVTYFASITMTQWILSLFGIDTLNWAVPFFSLIIFAALGIDYSIFIIDRFREELANHSIRDAIEIAIRRMGTVVITAVIILSGTFAALYPSGIVILVQVTSIIIFALLFYAFIVLPLLVPALIVTFNRGNWWPFRMPGGKEREDKFKDE